MFYGQRNDVNNAVNAALGYWQPNALPPTANPQSPGGNELPTGGNVSPAAPSGNFSEQRDAVPETDWNAYWNNLGNPANYSNFAANNSLQQGGMGNMINTLNNLSDAELRNTGFTRDPQTRNYTFRDPQTGEIMDVGATGGLTSRQYDPQGRVIQPGQPGYDTSLQSAQRGAQDTRYTDPNVAANRVAQGEVYDEPAAPEQGGRWIPGDLERYYDPAISLMSDTADANMWAYNDAKNITGKANQVSNRAADLMANPSNVWNMPGTREEFKTGLNAMQAGFSKSMGGGTSGKVMVGRQFTRDALDRELGLLDREVGFYDKDLSRLSPFVQMGYEARNNAANLMAQRGIATANIRVGGAAGLTGLAGTTGQGISQASQNIGNAWANNAINQANIQGNFTNNLSNNVNSLATLYAMRPDLFSS
jgi:hypothetical protein